MFNLIYFLYIRNIWSKVNWHYQLRDLIGKILGIDSSEWLDINTKSRQYVYGYLK